MSSEKSRSPYSLYRKKTKSGSIWYATFWDEQKRKYTITRSTGVLVSGKKGRRRDAEQAAQAMLPGICFNTGNKPQDASFIGYVSTFWRPDSPYVKECAIVKKKPLARNYIKMNQDDVERHIRTFQAFRGLTLKELKAGHIRDWLTWMAEKGLSGRRINSVLQTMRVAVRYAVQREDLEKDPFKGIGEAAEQPKEKGVLTNAEVSRIINISMPDPRKHLAVLLGLCSLRRGEVRGLQWQDIDVEQDYINVCHNFIDNEGVKSPKHGSKRRVPLLDSVKNLLNEIRVTSKYESPEDYVFESLKCPEKPLGNNFMAKSLALGFYCPDGKPICTYAPNKRATILYHR